jgi:DmsE family decaheme c-type cytochrome
VIRPATAGGANGLIMRKSLWLAALILVGSLPLAARAADAQAADAPAADAPAANSAPVAAAPEYTQTGADTCLKCHSEPAVTGIFRTKHAVGADARTPFAQEQCESCHGPGAEHSKKLHVGDPRPPMPLFAAGSKASVAKQNGTCLACHQSGHRIGWQGSVHQREDVACVSCHRLHAEHDPVTVVAEQPVVCYQCHQKVRADFEKFSAHPVRDGDMACTSCHAPHDALYPALLTRPTLNQTCYTCHAEKRGPFLWEHAPVAEDCSNCHTPHGSVNPALLLSRPPLLCQQCHSQADHPSMAATGAGLARGQASSFLLAGSCTNCHSQVHGSNAPSGADLNR